MCQPHACALLLAFSRVHARANCRDHVPPHNWMADRSPASNTTMQLLCCKGIVLVPQTTTSPPPDRPTDRVPQHNTSTVSR